MVLDVCATLPATREVLRTAVDRTAAWAERARRRHRRLEASPPGQALFGIVQGGTDPILREESAERTVALDFDGYGIGGLSVGETRDRPCSKSLAATVPHLPADRPRYLMGVGDPVGTDGGGRPRGRPVRLRGPDPDGPARAILTADGRLNLRNAALPPTTDPSTPVL
jgi:queuine tRNA-ribosyltransferase